MPERRLTDRQRSLLRNIVIWKDGLAGGSYYLFADDRAVARALIKRGMVAINGPDDGSPPQFVVPTPAGREAIGMKEGEDV